MIQTLYFLQLRLGGFCLVVVVKAQVGIHRCARRNERIKPGSKRGGSVRIASIPNCFDALRLKRLHVFAGEVSLGGGKHDVMSWISRIREQRSAFLVSALVGIKASREDQLLYYQSDEHSRYGYHHGSFGRR